MSLTEVLVAVVLAVGLVGIVVPVLPGSALVWAGVLVWTLSTGGATAWAVLAVVTVLLVGGAVAKYAVPGRRMRTAGVPASTQWAGAALAVLGFFVVPVVGLVLGFVLGVYLAERRRVGARLAWPSTRAALSAAGLSILIELAAAVLATLAWVAGVVAT